MNERILIGKPLLENVFGENNQIRVLDFFLMGKDFDFTLSQVHYGTKLSRTAIRNAIKRLEDVEVIEKSRRDKKSKYYRLNRNSDKYDILTSLYEKIKAEERRKK